MSGRLEFIRGTNNKPASSKLLTSILASHTDFEGELYLGFPIIGTPEGPFQIDAIWISKQFGVLIIDLVEESNLGDYDRRQDNAYNKLSARLQAFTELVAKRKLLVPIHTVTFAPRIANADDLDDEYKVANGEDLARIVSEFHWEDQDDTVYARVLSALQSITAIRRNRVRRNVKVPDSRGSKLKTLEDSIATLDTTQSKAVVETVKGVQRIRGLAGSGKTVILALKAAYWHEQHPDWRIAVTFNTRSLKGHFRRLINGFTLDKGGAEPDWEQLRVVNAWGAPGGTERGGLYYEFCKAHEIPYQDFGTAKIQYGSVKAFGKVCELALEQIKGPKPIYDAILIDEAQDFPPSFLKLCYSMVGQGKPLVYAYDELQNLSESSLPPPEEIFGLDASGKPQVSFDQQGADDPLQDVILEKCYRNSRPVLVTAHALGFGIYRKPPRSGMLPLVQMFDSAQLWEEIGYEVKRGELQPGVDVVLARSADSSPTYLEEHSSIDDLIRFEVFDDEEEQANSLVKAIIQNLKRDELTYNDIVVINPDPITTRDKVGLARKKLLEQGISSHIAGVDTDPDVFYKTDSESITFTGVFRAKGNEAGMVYVINANDCHSSTYNLATLRNRLFTAITRSQAWVRVFGVGEEMRKLKLEYDTLKEKRFELHFTIPTEEQRKQLRVVHRDMTTTQIRHLNKRKGTFSRLVKELETGQIHMDDLDTTEVERLEKLLKSRKK